MTRQALGPIFLLACFMMGGASAAGFLANAMLQLIALVLITAALSAEQRPCPDDRTAMLMVLAVLLLALATLQLVPLPPSIWANLPGRSAIVRGYALLGAPLPWLPVSLAPTRTVYATIWLLPPAALALVMIRLGAFRPLWIGYAVIVAALVCVMLGALQLAGGDRSNWYLYARTNRGVAVGSFANANHMATLLVAAIPFLAAVYVTLNRRSERSRRAGITALAGAALAAITVGLFINGSLAGIGLAFPTAAASVLLVRGKRLAMPGVAWLIVGGVAATSVLVIIIGPFGNNLFGAGAENSQFSRFTTFTVTARAVLDFAPLGSGIGTFQQIYRTFEDPFTIDQFFRNNAHNDYLQVALETGLPGLSIFAVFGLWWVIRCRAIWGASPPKPFSQAATIASAAILLHSAVDYPLRTAAIAALLAACLALMTEAEPVKRDLRVREERQERHISLD